MRQSESFRLSCSKLTGVGEQSEVDNNLGKPFDTSPEAELNSSANNNSLSGSTEKETVDMHQSELHCLACRKAVGKEARRCKLCGSGCYCSEKCQVKHQPKHQEVCKWIQQLEKIENSKRVLTVQEVCQVNYRTRNKLVKLVGEKPMLHCTINDQECEALWDTGAMVSVVSEDWLMKNAPDQELKTITEFLEGDNFHLSAANNTPIEIKGIAVMGVGIGKDFNNVPVPFVVSGEQIENPIIGYNVIKHVVQSELCDLAGLLHNACPSLSKSKAEAVISVIRMDVHDEFHATVTANTLLPPNARVRVKCNTKFTTSEVKQNAIFTPYPRDSELEMAESVVEVKMGRRKVNVVVTNPTNQPITLEKGTVLGSVESFSAVIPIHPKEEELSKQKPKAEEGAINSVLAVDKEWLPPVDLSHLSEEERKIAETILREENEAFSSGKDDIGNVCDLQMEIMLTDQVPVVIPHRHIPRHLYDEVKNFINDLIVNKWVRESKSPYSSPIVCVRKKDQSLRLCIDYRALNKKIIPDRQPIPRIQEILDGLGGQEYFSTLDMAKAYHQGYVSEEFRKYTAFSTPWGLYEWIRIPMGISTAPPAFQRFINQTLVGLRDKVCMAYLDDILIYGRTFEEQANNLQLVLQRLKSRGIKLRADKCKLFLKEVRYLGRLISKHGHRPDPADTAALEKFRIPPKTIGELRTLLGFLGYYRSYVRDFSKKFQPIYQLLQTKHKTESKPDKKPAQKNSKSPIEWTTEHQQVVDNTINYLKSPEFLIFPDYNVPFILNCDASEKGLGAVLYQKKEGVDRVVSFGSKTLTDSEKNYHLHSGKLEFLSLKWAITEKFSDYLLYSPGFTVFTDNNPLTYVMSSAKLNATGLRWVAELSNYQFSIRYKPGKKNGDADGLSRFPMTLEEMEETCTERVELRDVSTVMAVKLHAAPVLCSENVNINMLQLVGNVDKNRISQEELRKEQMEDGVIGPIYRCVKENRRPSKEEWGSWTKNSKVIMHQFKKLGMEKDMLVRKISSRTQIVLPEKFRQLVFEELHCKMGHLGAEKVEELARQRFYWPYMKADIEHFIRDKCACVASKRPNVQEKAPLVPIHSTAPFEMICIDFLHLDVCQGGFEYVLLVTDHFSKYTQAYATKNKSSKAAAEKLFNEYIPQFGFPKKIHHDMGGEFNSSLFAELHRLTGMRMSNTTPYHPMGNGLVERMNRTLINMLKALQEKEKKQWKKHLSKLMFAYNSTVHKSTGYSPFFLLFGRESRLPIDCILPIEPNKTNRKTYDQFVKEWKSSMKEAHQIVSEQIEKAGLANKRLYDAKIKTVHIEVGDRVLVRNKEKGGTGKLRSWWEPKLYEVMHIRDTVPVYTVRALDEMKTKQLHRNLLMKANDLPLDTFGQTPMPIKPIRRLKKKKNVSTIYVSESDSDSDSTMIVVRTNASSGLRRSAVVDELEDLDEGDSDIEALYDAIQGNAGVDTDESEDQGEEQLPVTENRHSHNNMDPASSPASTHQPCEGSRRDPPTTHTMAEGGDIASHNTHYSQTSAVEEIQRPPAVHLDVEDLRPAVDEGMGMENEREQTEVLETEEEDDEASTLPPGFTKKKDARGRTFYIDHNNKTTSWDKPVVMTSSPDVASQSTAGYSSQAATYGSSADEDETLPYGEDEETMVQTPSPVDEQSSNSSHTKYLSAAQNVDTDDTDYDGSVESSDNSQENIEGEGLMLAADDTIPYQEGGSGESSQSEYLSAVESLTETEELTDSAMERPRYPKRKRMQRKVFTFESLGGAPKVKRYSHPLLGAVGLYQ